MSFRIIDPFYGQIDLVKGLIRTVGDPNRRFKEDALRMMRAIRIGAQLAFNIEKKTFTAIQKNVKLLKHVSWERIRDEFLKIIASNYPADGVLLLHTSGLLEYILPELTASRGIPQAGHHIYDVWTHSIESLRHCPSSDPIVRLGALLHDVGKIGVREHVLSKATKLPERHMQIIRLRLHFAEKTGELPRDLPDAEKLFTRLQKINASGFLLPEDRDFILRLAEIAFSIGGEKLPLLDEEEKEALLIPRGNLLPHEWAEIKRHPAESDRILEQIPFPKNMANLRTIVRQHHEKLDGSGYPDGKKEEEILLQSRILTICDIYDALTAADRPYKKAFSVEKAVAILREEASSGKLDARLVDIFIKKVVGWADTVTGE